MCDVGGGWGVGVNIAKPQAAFCVVMFLLCVFIGCASVTAEPTTQPGSDVSGADAWLDRIEMRANKLETLQSDITYDRYAGLIGDKQRRKGKLWFDASSPARFAIVFDKLIVDGRLDKLDKHYVYDGTWLVDRDNIEKVFIKRQLVAPDKKADPLRLGEGPFALPITAKKADILKRFDVVLVEAEPRVHLRLTPKAGRRMDFTQLDLWYDVKLLVPMRIETTNADDQTRQVIELRDVKLDEPFDAGRFDTGEPQGAGWRVEVKPYEGDG